MREGGPSAGWYNDPTEPGERYWDGTRWTEHSRSSSAPQPPAPVPSVQLGGQPQVVYVQQQTNGLAVAGLVCGIVGLVLGLIPILFVVAWALGLIGFVLALVGRSRATRTRTWAVRRWRRGALSSALRRSRSAASATPS